MIDLDELERVKKADIARAEQARQFVERSTLALRSLLPDFKAELLGKFIAEKDNYNSKQMSQAAKIEVDPSREDCHWLNLSRLSVRPYACVAVMCVQRDSIATVTCMVNGDGINGEENASFSYTLKARGNGIGVFDEHDRLSTPEWIVSEVMRQFLYYLLG